jgi:hypothetical protein
LICTDGVHNDRFQPETEAEPQGQRHESERRSLTGLVRWRDRFG